MASFFRKYYDHFMWTAKKVKDNLIIEKIERSVPKYGLNKDTQRKSKVIISLTSYDKRFTTLPLCLKSLLKQTVMPDKIILYLAEKDSSSITKQMKELKQFGIEIVIVEGDLKPHKKYYYAMRDYPNAIVITVDDDVIYDKNLVRRLLLAHNNHPKTVIADRARLIKTSESGFSAYNSWELAKDVSKPSLELLATGVGGILYPPHVLDTDLLLSVQHITKYISVDDLWLKAVEILSNTPTMTSVNNCKHSQYIDIHSSNQDSALSNTNVIKNENDKYWMQLDKEFNLFSKIVIDKKKTYG